MQWLKDGLSLDETRISALVLAFFLTLALSFYQVINAGDISDNLLVLLGYELAAFTGIKVTEQIVTKKSTTINTVTDTVSDATTDTTTTQNLP